MCMKASRCFLKFIQVSPQYNGIQENVVTLFSSALLQVYNSANGNKRVITCSPLLIHIWCDICNFITPIVVTVHDL